MAVQTASISAIAKYSAALCTLHGGQNHAVVAQPFRNQPTSLHRRHDGYSLSFEDELRLARHLAFLAYTKDDPNCIPALCIEEDYARAALNVRIATNTGVILLEKAVTGLQRIFDLMASAEDLNAQNGLESRIVTEILKMCTPRILGRLGLGTQEGVGKGRIKKPICDALDNVCEILDTQQDNPTAQLSKQFVAGCHGIRKAVQQWSAYHSSRSLSAVVQEVHRFERTIDIAGILKGIPRQNLPQSAGDSITNRICKISRYVHIARYLCRRAKSDSRYRGLRAAPVDISSQALASEFASTGDQERTQVEAATLEAIILPPKTVKRLYGMIGLTKERANTHFRQRLAKTLKDAKVHAEVKLACFYELSADTDRPALLPRAVCSSKDACWLCNAFLQLHGGMFTPRCHGVLYPAWRIPSLTGPSRSRMAGLSTRMSQKLQTEVNNCVSTTLARGQKITYPSPLESSLSFMKWSVSTVYLPQESTKLPIANEKELVISAKESAASQNTETAVPSSRSQLETHSVMNEREVTHSLHSRPAERMATIRLDPGITYHHRPAIGESSIFIEASTLHLHVEFPMFVNEGLGRVTDSSHVSYTIGILDRVELAIIATSPTTQVVNAKDIEGDFQYTEDHTSSVYIKAGDLVVRLRRIQGFKET